MTSKSAIIIHISDIHFGEKHIFNPPKTPGGETANESGYPTLFDSIKKDLAANNIENNDGSLYFCLTGDFVEKPTETNFSAAFNFINDLKKAFNLNSDKILIVPGNHDVDYEQNENNKRFNEYIEFYNNIYDTTHKRSGISGIRIITKSNNIIFACLNSSLFVRRGTEDSKIGRLSDEQLNNLEDELKSINNDEFQNSIKVALIHHHPVLIPSLTEAERGYDAVFNSGSLIRILKKHHFQLILHGHKHNPHSFTEDSLAAYEKQSREQILIVAGGSAGSSELPSNPACTNSYNIIRIKHIPKSKQSRININTRGLVKYDTNFSPLLTHKWHWNSICTEDWYLKSKDALPLLIAKQKKILLDNKKYDERAAVYELSRYNLPVAEIRPSFLSGQDFEVVLWIEQHEPKTDNEKAEIPVKVIYNPGRYFSPIEVERYQNDKNFATAFSYYGPTLIQVILIFADGKDYCTYIYAHTPSNNEKNGIH